MTRPRALVLHQSMFGNTAAIAAAVTEGLAEQGYLVESREVRDQGRAVPGLDLLVLGATTLPFAPSGYGARDDDFTWGSPATCSGAALRGWLNDAPLRADAPLVAVFDTRVPNARWLPGASGSLARLARRRGLRVVGRPRTFHVTSVHGPVGPGELHRAMAWALDLGAAARARIRSRPRAARSSP